MLEPVAEKIHYTVYDHLIEKEKVKKKQEWEFQYIKKVTKFIQESERVLKKAENSSTSEKKKYEGIARVL